ncbi:wall-associated receptor kinase 4-like [Panicum miliaceum]|uniref:Wall-associated receptor kinase 4-like n=1 Tax=Panicum miliaceum TaxID=4540 RepID=A0A3L6TBU8_PANMI|nr:wall-associated receptor kinase 4-like [Panicum miliaceum]
MERACAGELRSAAGLGGGGRSREIGTAAALVAVGQTGDAACCVDAAGLRDGRHRVLREREKKPDENVYMQSTVATLTAAAGRRGCPTKCGGVDVPYPFGIGAGCFRSKGFEISCVNGTTAALPSATHYTIPVTSLSVAPQPEARNAFVVLGCNTGAYTSNSVSNGTGRYNYQYYMGFFTYCSGPGSAVDGRCASVGNCRVDIAPGLTNNVVNFEEWAHDGMDYSPCDIAFLVDKDGYDFRASDLRMDVERSSMPVWLDWAIRDESALTCALARNSTRYACVSAHSECVDSANVPGYFCRCKQGFEGNPYEDNGCTSKYLLSPFVPLFFD